MYIGSFTYTVFYIILLLGLVAGDLFTSVHEMEVLAYKEYQLIITLSDYISAQRANWNILSHKYEQVKRERPPSQSVRKVISNPVSAFAMVRRLTREWPLILHLMIDNPDMREELARLPREEDMESAIRGLTRLQHVYQLDTEMLSTDFDILTGNDCMDIGNFLMREHKYEVAKTWFVEGLQKLLQENVKHEDKFLSHLFLATIKSDCEKVVGRSWSDVALSVLQMLMNKNPDYTLDHETSQLFTHAVSVTCSTLKEIDNQMAKNGNFGQFYDDSCRRISSVVSSKLKCFYIHHNNPSLMIAPFKMEELHLNPPVLKFHNVISQQEIHKLKTAFNKVKIKCATLRTNNQAQMNYFRTCDLGWIDPSDEVSDRLTRRVRDMTHLSVASSEPPQVVSYGLAGEYVLHNDTTTDESLSNNPSSYGGRIATVMFYLNEVEGGGHTVFPLTSLAVEPEQGSALFWFNMDHLGESLPSMVHGGCPVLVGSKWILNKWIHEAGQSGEMFCPVDDIFPKERYYLNSVKH